MVNRPRPDMDDHQKFISLTIITVVYHVRFAVQSHREDVVIYWHTW